MGFKTRTAFEVARGVKAFLFLDAGLTRERVPDLELELKNQSQTLEQTRSRVADQEQRLQQANQEAEQANREIEGLRQQLAEKEQRISALQGSNGSALASGENIIWVFGTIRTGSTWLGFMMRDLPGHMMWNEPRVGEMFGYFFYERAAHRKENKNFILSLDRKPAWIRSLRRFILESVAEKYPKLARGDDYLVIKEPSGSIGAPLIMEALPESRMILLVRDPRDVVASALDASRKGSWTHQLKGSRKRREKLTNDPTDVQGDEVENRNPDEVVREQAAMYLRYVGNSRRAYEAHEGPKTMVRYEELLADTLGTMKRIYSELEIPVAEEELEKAVEENSWQNIPAEEKGEGKFYRKGRAGSWREDLSAEQAKMVEEITAPLLEEFYYSSESK